MIFIIHITVGGVKLPYFDKVKILGMALNSSLGQRWWWANVMKY